MHSFPSASGRGKGIVPAHFAASTAQMLFGTPR